MKCSHHAQFDEAWYLQPTRPPAPQLLYNLGITHDEAEETTPSPVQAVVSEYRTPGTVERLVIPWPPVESPNKNKLQWDPPISSLHLHLPLCALSEDIPRIFPARAARAQKTSHKNIAVELVNDFNIGKQIWH